MRFWNNLHQVCSEPNNLKNLLEQETEGFKQDSQHQLRLPMLTKLYLHTAA